MEKIEVWWLKMVEIFARPVSEDNELFFLHYLLLFICIPEMHTTYI